MYLVVGALGQKRTGTTEQSNNLCGVRESHASDDLFTERLITISSVIKYSSSTFPQIRFYFLFTASDAQLEVATARIKTG